MGYSTESEGTKGIPSRYRSNIMEAVEMDNPIFEVPDGAEVLVKGKKVSGSRCKSGKLHTGYQLAGLHPCACPVKKKAAAKTKTETKKKKAPAKKKGK